MLVYGDRLATAVVVALEWAVGEFVRSGHSLWRGVDLHVACALALMLALIENDQCCSLKVTTLARVQGSSM
jgi:hypothetical protein